MKEKFLAKYQDYCRTRERKEELFKMVQKEDGNLEDFMERLQYNLQRSDHPNMSKDILKSTLLKGVRDDCLDMLNMLGKRDICKESYDEIVNICKRCSRGVANRPKSRDSTYSRVKKKQAEAEAALAIFYSKCREKHPLRECPLDKVPICTIYEKDHETQQCPSLPRIKAALQPTEEEHEAVFLLTRRRQWQPRGQGTNSNMPFNRWNNHPPFQENYPPLNQMQYPRFNQMNFPPMQQPNPPFVDPTIWNPWALQQSYFNEWNPSSTAQQIPFPNQFPQYQQSLSVPSNAPLNNQTIRPQLPVQPNPNPNNNKALQVIDIQNQPIFPMQCNDIHLQSGRVVKPIIDDITSSNSDKEETRKDKSSIKNVGTVESSSNKTTETTEPPFHERLALTKTLEPLAFNLLGELQNLYVKIPLLQALRDVPIYARTVRDICTKKPGRKAKDPITVHVMGDLTALMSGKTPPVKYGDPDHPIVTVQVGKTFVSKVLVDLGASINIMTLENAHLLQLKNVIRETPTILELADRSTIKPEGVIEDLIILVESWNYPADFVVLQTKTKLGGHPLILGRPWLATADAFISCRSGSMTISNGCETK
eukprot:PITA_22524